MTVCHLKKFSCTGEFSAGDFGEFYFGVDNIPNINCYRKNIILKIT